jgi:hypothetical protein
MEDGMRHCRASGWIAAGVVALPLAGCANSGGGGGLTAPSSTSGATAPGGSAQTLILDRAPFKGQDSGTFEFTADTCPAGLAPLRTHTTGTATLIGAYSFETVECFDTEAFTFSGSFAIVAAKGDTLVGAYAGHITGFLDNVTSTNAFTATVTGGTGRLAGASGAFSGTGQANLATFDESRAFAGTIAGVPPGQS